MAVTGIVIIGAGHGGVQLAVSLRDEGYSGPVTLLSEEPDLPYHKPPLSKSFMKQADAPLQPLRAERTFADKALTLRMGCVATHLDRVNRRVHLGDGEVLDYAHLVLATGTDARRLAVPGADLPGVFHLRTASDARALRAALPDAGRVVVIGGGFIGLEVAAMLAARGLGVDVVELGPQVLGRAVSRPVAGAIADALGAQGVGLHCGTGVERLVGGDRVGAVQLADGRELPADLVIAGIGAVPRIALAQAAGLDCADGIVVDALLRSSDPAIHAIGDCAVFPQAQLGRMARLESVQNATDQARALAATLAGRPAPYAALAWFWSDIGAQKLQIAGLSAGSDEDIVVRDPEGGVRSVWRLAQGRLVAVETLNAAGEHMIARRLIADGVTPDRAAMASGDVAVLRAAHAAAQAPVG